MVFPVKNQFINEIARYIMQTSFSRCTFQLIGNACQLNKWDISCYRDLQGSFYCAEATLFCNNVVCKFRFLIGSKTVM